jgi:hypothetical protein
MTDPNLQVLRDLEQNQGGGNPVMNALNQGLLTGQMIRQMSANEENRQAEQARADEIGVLRSKMADPSYRMSPNEFMRIASIDKDNFQAYNKGFEAQTAEQKQDTLQFAGTLHNLYGLRTPEAISKANELIKGRVIAYRAAGKNTEADALEAISSHSIREGKADNGYNMTGIYLAAIGKEGQDILASVDTHLKAPTERGKIETETKNIEKEIVGKDQLYKPRGDKGSLYEQGLQANIDKSGREDRSEKKDQRDRANRYKENQYYVNDVSTLMTDIDKILGKDDGPTWKNAMAQWKTNVSGPANDSISKLKRRMERFRTNEVLRNAKALGSQPTDQDRAFLEKPVPSIDAPPSHWQEYLSERKVYAQRKLAEDGDSYTPPSSSESGGTPRRSATPAPSSRKLSTFMKAL